MSGAKKIKLESGKIKLRSKELFISEETVSLLRVTGLWDYQSFWGGGRGMSLILVFIIYRNLHRDYAS